MEAVNITQQQFEQLVAGMLSSDNQIRSVAERSYEQIPIGPKGTLLFSVFLNTSVNVEVNVLLLCHGQ